MSKQTVTLSLPFLLMAVLLVSLTHSASIYNTKKSYVTQLTNFNFENQVSKIRQNTNQVSIVHFYKESGTSLT